MPSVRQSETASMSQQYPAHGALYRIIADAFQKFLARVILIFGVGSQRKECLLTIGLLLALLWLPGEASAAQCGSTAAGFEAWKRQFAGEAQARGVSASTIAALVATNYSTATIAADRGQRSFSLSLDQFLAKRGGSAIVARGRALKQSNAALFASIQQRFGVPPGPLLAIWGMETGFGSSRGNQNVLSAVATLAYDCRRSAYFTDQL
jgi:membrane-bound lytic murein transglycosylase B